MGSVLYWNLTARPVDDILKMPSIHPSEIQSHISSYLLILAVFRFCSVSISYIRLMLNYMKIVCVFFFYWRKMGALANKTQSDATERKFRLFFFFFFFVSLFEPKRNNRRADLMDDFVIQEIDPAPRRSYLYTHTIRTVYNLMSGL